VDGTLQLGPGAINDSPSTARPAGTIIDKKYRLLGLLGEGGMGTVYKAHHLMLDKTVALKTFRSATLSPEAFLRFQREAQAIARLNQVNIVQVYDFGLSEEGIPYYTMEYLIGQSLAEKIQSEDAMPAKTVVSLFRQICQGLASAHAKGIVHRDLKPANLFLTSSGPGTSFPLIKIVDFGIASLIDGEEDANKITTHGAIFGSPLYMSPEQSRGEPVNQQSDIYSLGCALFEALTGEPPFRGPNALETIMMHNGGKAPSLQEKSDGQLYPLALERLVARMLEKIPAFRPANVSQVEAELSAVRFASEEARPASLRTENDRQEELEEEEEEREEREEREESEPDKEKSLALPLVAIGLSMALATALIIVAVFFIFFQHPSQQVEDSKPIGSGKIGIDARGERIASLQFPANYELGVFYIGPPPNNEKYPRGSFDWPASTFVTFRPSKQFLSDPKNFRTIPDNSLLALSLAMAPEKEALPELEHCLERLKDSLLKFSVDSGVFYRSGWKALYPLNRLTALSLNFCSVDGSDFIQLPRFSQLKSVEMAGGTNAHILLKALANSKRIEMLRLSGDPLTVEDLRTIASMPNLVQLNLSGTVVSDDNLALLLPLKKLKLLNLEECQITKASLPIILQMHNNGLQGLRLTTGLWSSADEQRIKESFPGIQFNTVRINSSF
jgi:serine/threonine protein kinase